MTQDGALCPTNGLNIQDHITQDKWHIFTAECLILSGITTVSVKKFFITDALNSRSQMTKSICPLVILSQTNHAQSLATYHGNSCLWCFLHNHHYYMSMTSPGRTIYARKTQMCKCFEFSAVLKDLPPYSHLSYFFDRHPDLQVIDLKVCLKQSVS